MIFMREQNVNDIYTKFGLNYGTTSIWLLRLTNKNIEKPCIKIFIKSES